MLCPVYVRVMNNVVLIDKIVNNITRADKSINKGRKHLVEGVKIFIHALYRAGVKIDATSMLSLTSLDDQMLVSVSMTLPLP